MNIGQTVLYSDGYFPNGKSRPMKKSKISWISGRIAVLEDGTLSPVYCLTPKKEKSE